MKKWFILVLTLTAAVFSLTACVGVDDSSGSAEESEEGEGYITVGFTQVGSESDWRVANTQSMKDTLTEENGYYLIYEDAQNKQENQLKAVRSFILQEVDYIVLDPVVETGWDSVLQEAKDAGIPVIVTDRKVVVKDESLYTCWVGSDFEEEGRKAGKWLLDYLKGKGRGNDSINIVTLQGTMDSSAQIGRTQGFSEVLDENKNWHMLAMESADFTQTKAQEVMEAFLETYTDIDVVVCENDNMAFGAVDAIKEAGKTCGPDGDITIISFDAVKATFEAMQRGDINVTVECNPLQGPKVAEIIEKLENNEEVEKVQYMDEKYYDTTMDLESLIKERTY